METEKKKKENEGFNLRETNIQRLKSPLCDKVTVKDKAKYWNSFGAFLADIWS